MMMQGERHTDRQTERDRRAAGFWWLYAAAAAAAAADTSSDALSWWRHLNSTLMQHSWRPVTGTLSRQTRSEEFNLNQACTVGIALTRDHIVILTITVIIGLIIIQNILSDP